MNLLKLTPEYAFFKKFLFDEVGSMYKTVQLHTKVLMAV